MTMQDPIADMLTRIRNAQRTAKKDVKVPYATFKEAIAKVLVEEGYLVSMTVEGERPQDKHLLLVLKYFEGQGVISRLERVSKPSLRKSVGKDAIEAVPGFGISIISTSQGVMSGRAAKRLGLGGELICVVS